MSRQCHQFGNANVDLGQRYQPSAPPPTPHYHRPPRERRGALPISGDLSDPITVITYVLIALHIITAALKSLRRLGLIGGEECDERRRQRGRRRKTYDYGDFDQNVRYGVLLLREPSVDHGFNGLNWFTLCQKVSPENLEAVIDEYRRSELPKKNETAMATAAVAVGEKKEGMTDNEGELRRIFQSILCEFLDPNDTFGRHGTVNPDQKRMERVLSIYSAVDLARDGDLNCIWRKLELLVGFSSGDGNSMHLAHFLVKYHFSNILVRLAGRLCPEQFELPDEDGRLPLHHAAENLLQLRADSGSDEIYRHSNMLILVLKICPGAAQHKDKNGKLPMTSYLESGLGREQIAMALIKAAPSTLQTQDHSSGLLPFMSAAAAAASDKDDTSGSGSLHGLEVAYRLLREDPAVLSHLRRSGTHGNGESEELKLGS